MSKITWDADGQRFYEAGVDHGVLYTKNDEGTLYAKASPWDGLINVEESPSGAESTALYADNIKYGEIISNEDFGYTIEAYTFPEEFRACDGSKEIAPGVYAGMQNREVFGFSYRTKIGNDTAGIDLGYKIHLVYGSKAKPSSKSRATINESVEAMTMSWEATTTPVAVGTVNGKEFKPTSHIEIDSTKVSKEKLEALEALLYGSDDAEAKLPMPSEIIALMSDGAEG